MQDVGYCQCGCGARTRLAPRTDRRRGWTKGEPLCYVVGHTARSNRSGPEYAVSETGCWIWQRTMTPQGYGRDFTKAYAHRVYYEAVYGPIPTGHEVHHRCTVRACVNPEHLVAVAVGEHAQQQDDSRSKLTSEQVAAIRERLATMGGTLVARAAALADEYGVAPETIRAIHYRNSWRDVARDG